MFTQDYYYYYYSLRVLDGFPLESEWQQVSSSLQNSFQYSGRSQQCFSLDGLHLSFHFQILKSLYQLFRVCTEYANYNRYHRYLHIP